jgi:glucan 1,3-beta-glucosidase
MPVTYADVWEFWLRYREVASAVDFITIHILPYWEDFPIPARDAAAHVTSIRAKVAAAFPGRDILIGEFGWPSAGRMREGALPSRINQARLVQEVLAQARRDGTRVNLIEAFDQPWKRQLEGTVGGHWGLYDAYDREPKFTWGAPVSNHPAWRWQAGLGIALAAAVFASALVSRRDASPLTPRFWLVVAAIAYASGALIGWTVENVPLESLTLGNWLRSLTWAAAAVLAPLAAAAALASGAELPGFASMLARREMPPREPLPLLLGALLIVLALLAMQAALGLTFDPRYRDFPFAPFTGAVVSFLALVLWRRSRAKKPDRKGERAAEKATVALLVLSAAYIALNEGFANWQALWFCGDLIALALTLQLTLTSRASGRDAPG